MSKDPSFLFSGIKFDRKKFANDFSKFKEKKETVDTNDDLLENGNPESEVEKLSLVKKRKRKALVSDPVEGFNVFKTSNLEAVSEEKNSAVIDSEGKKELYRQMERDALLRKKHSIHISGTNVPSPLQNFAELRSRYKCRSYLVRNLAELVFKEPTPIQRQAIPVILSGRECFACAPTGSGKTLAFVCPMLMKLKRSSRDGIRALILLPTRELAAQTARECKKLARGKKFYIKLMTKQLVKTADFSKLHCDILISTPYRVQFAILKKKLDLSRVEYLVLDESDKLFELGLVEQVDLVVKACSNPSILRSLFSATLPDSVEELARTLMHDAVRVIIGRKNSASESIKQKLIFVGSEEGKLLAIRQSFAESLNPPVLVFVQNKERVKELYKELIFDNTRADVIHADLSQVQDIARVPSIHLTDFVAMLHTSDPLQTQLFAGSWRENAVDNFRAGKTWVLIATDVIARGMDFKGINSVINYDFPDSPAAYIHRIGRCGRAGRSGEAITLYTEADVPFLRNIANVMTASGCEIPAWILALPKRKWKKHRPGRESISTKPQDEDE